MNKGRKITGGKYHADRKKKSYERTNQENIVTLGETKRKLERVRGGNPKIVLLNDEVANVVTDKGVKPAQITNVLETPNNLFLARQNRIMKGAIIETSVGKARITNRPAREGAINAVLIKE